LSRSWVGEARTVGFRPQIILRDVFSS
jgi:hypothetical protein